MWTRDNLRNAVYVKLPKVAIRDKTEEILSIVQKIGQVLKKYCVNAHYAANPSWPFSPIKELKQRHNIVWLGVW